MSSFIFLQFSNQIIMRFLKDISKMVTWSFKMSPGDKPLGVIWYLFQQIEDVYDSIVLYSEDSIKWNYINFCIFSLFVCFKDYNLFKQTSQHSFEEYKCIIIIITKQLWSLYVVCNLKCVCRMCWVIFLSYSWSFHLFYC